MLLLLLLLIDCLDHRKTVTPHIVEKKIEESVHHQLKSYLSKKML